MRKHPNFQTQVFSFGVPLGPDSNLVAHIQYHTIGEKTATALCCCDETCLQSSCVTVVELFFIVLLFYYIGQVFLLLVQQFSFPICDHEILV